MHRFERRSSVLTCMNQYMSTLITDCYPESYSQRLSGTRLYLSTYNLQSGGITSLRCHPHQRSIRCTMGYHSRGDARVSVHEPNVGTTIPKFYADTFVVVDLPVDDSINLNLPPEEPVEVVYPENVDESVPTMSLKRKTTI